MKIATLDKLLEDQLKDIYNAENQLVKALPRMAKGAESPELRQAFTAHKAETERQVERLDRVAAILGKKLTGKTCAAMKGLLEEGKEVLEAEGPGPVIDAALIAAAQRVEHYEMAAYGTVRALAEHLGQAEIAKLLQETLDEESAADKKLTGVAMNLYAAEPAGAEAEEEEPAPAPAAPTPRRKRTASAS